MHDYNQIIEAVEFIKSKISISPKTAIVLGSGLGQLADEIENAVIISYEDIPNFAISKAIGHKNRLVIGYLNKKPIIAMQGRMHYYEGFTPEEVSFPIRVFQFMGIENLILTNAAGGLGEGFKAGDLMIINDHINFAGTNPLIGLNDDRLGVRFPDMSQIYNQKLQELASKAAKACNIDIKTGVYCWTAGPLFETPSEIKMFKILGVSAVGMSTVPEAIVACHGGIKVLGISCISNLASGLSLEPLSHKEVLEIGERVKYKFSDLIRKIIENIE